LGVVTIRLDGRMQVEKGTEGRRSSSIPPYTRTLTSAYFCFMLACSCCMEAMLVFS
jgi:hypothetical protein